MTASAVLRGAVVGLVPLVDISTLQNVAVVIKGGIALKLPEPG